VVKKRDDTKKCTNVCLVAAGEGLHLLENLINLSEKVVQLVFCHLDIVDHSLQHARAHTKHEEQHKSKLTQKKQTNKQKKRNPSINVHKKKDKKRKEMVIQNTSFVYFLWGRCCTGVCKAGFEGFGNGDL